MVAGRQEPRATSQEPGAEHGPAQAQEGDGEGGRGQPHPAARGVRQEGGAQGHGRFQSVNNSLSKFMGDGKVKLGRGPYAISTAILSMYTDFQHPGTKYMLAPGHRKMNFLCGFSCGFAKLSI